ncbi:hypothetical protein Tco_1096559 [Tanacetum coccineum]
MFKDNRIRIRGHIARNCTQPKHPMNSDYFKDKMLLMQAQENGAVLDEEELLFLVGEQPNTFDADVDNQPVRNLQCSSLSSWQSVIIWANKNLQDSHPMHPIFILRNREWMIKCVYLLQIESNGRKTLKKELHSVKKGQSGSPQHLRKAKVAQPTLYDGNEIINPDHDLRNVPSFEEDLELAKLARQKMHEKMNDPTCKKRITPTGITKGERGFEQTKRCYLTEVIPFFNLLKEHFDSVQKSLVTEVRAIKVVFENMEAEVDQNAVDKKCGEIKRKNLLITNENLIAECLSKDVFYTASDSVLNVSRFSDMHDALTIAQKRIADLESENLNMRNKVQNDDHDSMIKHFSRLEVEHFNLQLKYQNLKERENLSLNKENSDADPIFDLMALVSQNKDLTAKLNALHDLNERFRAENAKVKQHYKELYDSIKITRAKTTDQNNSLLSEIENLKAQLKDNSKCVTIPDSKPKVLAPGRYPIDVEPIPLRLKKNREVHLHYIKHLKENVETLREIVEEAKVERPLDTSLASACRYTKHSQELLEYVIGTYPKDFSPSNKQNASTSSLRKKRVTFVEPCETSTHNTPPQVEHQKINSTNAPGIPSTGVKGASAASRMQAQEQQELSIEEKATLFQQLLKKRRNHFAAKRAEEKRNKPPTKAQQRKIMCTFLKNMEGYKLKYLKLKEFDSIQEMFDRAFKRQKVEDDKEIAELKQLMKIIPNEEEVAIDAIPLAVNQMLKSFDKEDLEDLYKLLKAKYESTRPVEDLDLLLWGDLKTMFEPHVEDKIYMLVEKKYPLAPLTLSMMLEKKLMIDYESKMAYQLLKFTRKQLKK